MKSYFFLFLFIISFPLFCQNSLSIFEPLVDKTWKAEGTWGDGSKFIQETTFSYSLDKSIVIANSIGFIDKEQTKLGPRNHGVRQYDEETGKIHFWEFDVFGGLTKGILFTEGKNIYYQYEYYGSTVTDLWEFVDNSTYKYTVGNYVDGVWKQVYLQTEFKLSNQ